MSTPYVGEIRMFAGNFPPASWMLCDGAILPISEYDTLFSLIGTTYGGDGISTFALPDLQGRLPVHLGNGFIMGESSGVEQVTLNTNQIPAHSHALLGSSGNGSQTSPEGGILASSSVITPYANETPAATLAAAAIPTVGGSQPHSNMQPYLCVNFIISLYGIYPQSF